VTLDTSVIMIGLADCSGTKLLVLGEWFWSRHPSRSDDMGVLRREIDEAQDVYWIDQVRLCLNSIE
jgi:hypothetical protein